MSHYDFYNDYGCCAYQTFRQKFPEFATDEFEEFVVSRNRGDRDDGETQDIAAHEVLRLAYEFAERVWRFS